MYRYCIGILAVCVHIYFCKLYRRYCALFHFISNSGQLFDASGALHGSLAEPNKMHFLACSSSSPRGARWWSARVRAASPVQIGTVVRHRAETSCQAPRQPVGQCAPRLQCPDSNSPVYCSSPPLLLLLERGHRVEPRASLRATLCPRSRSRSSSRCLQPQQPRQ